MRINSVTAYHVRIPFKAAFGHALQDRNETDTVILEVTSERGETGVGEILARPYLTGETTTLVLEHTLPELVRRWLGQTLSGLEDAASKLEADLPRAGRNLATFAGWELALLDLAGKHFGFPAGQVLGPEQGADLAPGVVIDFHVSTDELRKHCIFLRLSGQRHVKIKVARPDDIRRLEVAASVFGPDIPLRIDANGGWTADEAVASLRCMQRFNICSVEQPVPAHDLEGMRRVREETGLAVVADESLCTLDDARRLISASAADVFNIRIAKCGGLLASRRLVRLAGDSGLRCQLGTLVGETGILLRAAEIFSRRIKGFEFFEGRNQREHLLMEDLVEPFTNSERTAGLGIALSRSKLTRWMVSEPKSFHSTGRRAA